MSDPVAEAAAQIAEQHTDVIPQESAQEAGTAAAGEPSGAEDAAAPLESFSSSSPSSAQAQSSSQGTTSAGGDEGNVDASTSPAGAATSAATDGELPNVASGAADPTAAQDSALNADGANTTLPTAASSAEPPLHMRIAMHLEAIYTMAREHVEAAPKEAAEQAQTVKTHIGDVLHRISNGMSVAEGELVQKLEALYRVL
jgi:hypothetical protein